MLIRERKVSNGGEAILNIWGEVGYIKCWIREAGTHPLIDGQTLDKS